MGIISEIFIGQTTLIKYEVLSYVRDLLLCGPSKTVIVETGYSIGRLLELRLIDRDLYVGTCFEYTIKSLKTKDKGKCYIVIIISLFSCVLKI